MYKILILLSAYNGSQYLTEQLDSIFAQVDVEVHVLARNDGSTLPETEEILHRYSLTHNLTYYTGANLGAAGSFYHLLQNAPDYDFYAFADQDDTWFPDKLITGIRAIAHATSPALYFSNYNLSDAAGNIIQHGIKRTLNLTKGNCFIESFSPGCSMVFNKALLSVVRRHIPAIPIMHDRWLFLTCMCFGTTIYDNTVKFNYRQHGSNVVGAKTMHSKMTDILRVFKKSDTPISRTAAAFLDSYKAELSADDQAVIRTCINYEHNLSALVRLLFSPTHSLAYGNHIRRTYWKIRILLRRI